MADPVPKDPELEKNSRTLREARRGQFEEMMKLAGVIGAVTAAVSGAHIAFQIAGAAFVALCILVSLPRWGRVKRYKRQDHAMQKRLEQL